MSIRSVKFAPQLSRLLKELPEPTLESLLAKAPFSEALSAGAPDNNPKGESLRARAREAFARTPKLDLVLFEREATRITRLDGPRADALHLRLSEGVDHGCRRDLEHLPGALARSADSFFRRPSLFRSIERAMQLRSYRENRRVYEAHDLQDPVSIDIGEIDADTLAAAVTDRLDLVAGCSIEAAELPDTRQTEREIMLAVIAGGALESQKTFEADRRIETIQYRPATELILVYRPNLGRIEVCGRDWSDRRAVVNLFARTVLREELTERPLTQRNYDLRPFADNLRPEIPASLAERIVELHVTQARYALGTFDRKVTISTLAGEPIDAIARNLLSGLGTQHGRPFLCDVELFLRVAPTDKRTQSLRFSVTNQNRSTLQAETDPDKRQIGFRLLEELGVVKTVADPGDEEVSELLPGLLMLLDHGCDTIGANELNEARANISRLTSLRFLTQRTIAAAVLIEDDDLGEVETSVVAGGAHDPATLGLNEDDVLRQDDLDRLLSWTINRDFVRETVLKRLQPMKLGSKLTDLGRGLFFLGNAQVSGEDRPVYLWEGGETLKTVEKVDRILRERRDSIPGLVLASGARSITFLGKHLVVSIGVLVGNDDAVDPDRLDRLWREGRAPATAADGVELDVHGSCAVLRIPGEDPWTIVGSDRVELVRKLYEAWKRGQIGRQTGDLVSHTASASPQAVLGADWKPLIVNRYIFSPKRGIWALKVPTA